MIFKNVIKHLRIFIVLVKFSLSKGMMYSLDFISGLLINLVFTVMHILVFLIIYNHTDNISGWNKYQTILFMGTFGVITSISQAFYFLGMIMFPNKVRSGDLDLFIVKPVNTRFYVAFNEFNISALFNLIPSILFIVYAVVNLDFEITIFRVIGYLVFLLMMISLHFNLMSVANYFAFYFIKTDAFGMMDDTLTNFTYRVPGVVYKGAAKMILYIVLPYGLLCTIPTKFFTDSLSFSDWIITISVFIAYNLIGHLFWKKGFANYSSSTS